MTRELLTDAAAELEAASAATADAAASDRLDAFAGQLRRQASREATPALGTLDRIQVKLREIERHSEETTVEGAIDRARDDILSFLDTLDDRGMQQR